MKHFHTTHYLKDGSDCANCDLFDISPKWKICKKHKKKAPRSVGWYGVKYECKYNPAPSTIHSVL